ncbi:uncharacterized protein Z520_02659 [Fonsecaea multimorphosa CBS 102226]|uniref:UTP23 sensor motif region domain-containing protein n=1 Tax=Fonsecaea multimorphosa CBS 102226 TaxID=1442371 RepID=A0A0D2IVM1_9EURO|nr:uncharacterized protein Z520_02659 [Fonsecaea multimorphosa CBS 102226]KIY01107.1 hypothetical protein Z520_02659 [Fonsecaea multimorphosa CBS 102226]OAL28728.1 hypothetical protein AYO22_02593 [Fonsecaea multimorphosa]
MRARRSKRYRKIMSAYQRSFSFHEPYQVLLDSHFLKTCHSFHMPLQKYLENTLHGECRLFVTRCTLAKIMADWEKVKNKEGNARGPPRPDFLPPPTEVPLRHCKHKDDEGQELGVVSEARCLLDLLAGQPHGNEHAKNKQHYILATADANEKESRAKEFIDVKDRARLIPGVPIVYVKRSVMILEEMSGVSERTVRTQEKEKFGQGLIGLGASRKRKRGEGEEEDSEGEDDNLLAEEKQGPKLRGLKRAKGPNPLSVKKKKVKVPPSNNAGHDGAAVEGEMSRKRPKRRGTRGRRDARNKSTSDSQGEGEVRRATATASAGSITSEA